MRTSDQEFARTGLPVTHRLAGVYGLYLAVAILMTGASIAGLLATATLYPSAALRQSSVPNDAVNLLLGLPILLGTMALARRSKLVGFGALFPLRGVGLVANAIISRLYSQLFCYDEVLL